MTESNEFLQVIVGGMDGNAAHGDILTEMFATFGERDPESARSDQGVLQEHLVEIAHAIEQQAVGVGGLDLEILRHHRRCAFRRTEWRNPFCRWSAVECASAVVEGVSDFIAVSE